MLCCFGNSLLYEYWCHQVIKIAEEIELRKGTQLQHWICEPEIQMFFNLIVYTCYCLLCLLHHVGKGTVQWCSAAIAIHFVNSHESQSAGIKILKKWNSTLVYNKCTLKRCLHLQPSWKLWVLHRKSISLNQEVLLLTPCLNWWPAKLKLCYKFNHCIKDYKAQMLRLKLQSLGIRWHNSMLIIITLHMYL